MSMHKYNYIIFHKGCFDGFTSFVILSNTNAIANDCVIFPDVPSAKYVPSQIENKNIIIMDVAYKYDILKQICNKAKHVTFIDHHITIHDDVLKLKNENNSKLNIIYDEKECGASLTWKYFHKKVPLPLLVRYIKDNDTGTWKLKHTHSFMAGISPYYDTSLTKENLKNWNNLLKFEKIKQIIKRGKIYREYIEHLLEFNSKKYSMESFPSEKIYDQFPEYFKKPGQYKVAVVCGSGCPSTSLLGLKMMETIDCDFVVMWSLNLDRKEYILAFRSKVTDVGKIAQMFGGGGHTLAAACSFPINKYNIQDLFFPMSLPRH